MKLFLKSGNFAISNRTIDFVNNIFKGICNSDITNNILSYILSSMYLTEYNTDNIIKLYIGVILYNKYLILNIDNYEIENNIIELIQDNIIKNFTFIKERFVSIKKDLKNISVPVIPEVKNIFSVLKNISSIEMDELYYKDYNINEDENIRRKKTYIEQVEKKLDIKIEDINASLRTLYLKKEYLEEIILTYKCYHNIETLHLIDDYN